MTRCILSVSFCLLALALLTSDPVVAALASPEDAKTPADSKADESPKEEKKDQADSQKKTAEAKPAESEEAKKEEPAPKKDEAEKKEATPSAASTPATLTIKTEPLKIEVSLDGAFEAEKTMELKLEPEAWTSFKVLTAVEHGERVKRDDVLVTMDLEKIDRAIKDLREDHKTADLDMKLAEQQLALLEKTTPMDLAANDRTHQYAQEDFDYYFKVTRPMSLKNAEFMLKAGKEYLENQEEELRQLEKMYKADDLTEETEEIILKRARSAVERAKFYLEMDKMAYERLVSVTIPRRDTSTKETDARGKLAYQDAQVALSVALKKQRLALQKLKVTRDRSEERLQHLLADRAAMTVKAPVSGVVYHGKFSRGKLSSSSSSSSGVQAGASIAAKNTFMTIVQPRPMTVRSSVVEKDLHNVRAGIKGTAVPAAFPELKLPVIVDRVSAVPMGAGSFDTRITVALDDRAEALMPGMTCKVKLVAYENKHAVTVPPEAIETDEADEDKKFVYVVPKKGKPKKRAVTLGKRTATKVEILKGLKDGEKILSEPPKKDK